MTNESFRILLEALKSHSSDAGSAYTNLRNSLVRYFQIKDDVDTDEAADEVLDRVALKLSQNTEIKNLTQYSFGVASLIFLERLRAAAKNKKAQTEFYAAREKQSNDDLQDDFVYFRECFQKLSLAEKNFMKDYFPDLPFTELTPHREKLCAEKKLSINNLRIKIYRLKQRLEDCVRKKLS